jgi:SCP-2 sterol transfer family
MPSALLTLGKRFVQIADRRHHPNSVIHAVRVMFLRRRRGSMEPRKGGAMTDTTTEFFQELEARGHDPRLKKATGRLRFDLTNGKRTARWLVTIEKGDIAVSHKNLKADCVVRADRKLFDGITSGEVNAFAAALRGTIGIEGNPELLVLFQRLFPGPPKSTS